jgi:hypothetical protein
LENLKATTYNLENGKVVETRLESSSVFKEKATSNLIYKKFSIPAVKEGSIIEFSYTINSEYLRYHRPWTFQGEYPCLWSEYETNIPDFFSYVVLSQAICLSTLTNVNLLLRIIGYRSIRALTEVFRLALMVI